MPPMMPPMMMYPMPPQKPRYSFVRGILVTLATSIFSLSLLLNFYLIMASGMMSGGASSRSTTILEGDPTQKVAIVPLDGVILEKEYERFSKLLDRVEKDGNVKAVVLQIDSPGGSVTASDQIYHRILRFKKEHPTVPVVTSMAGLAASGGYYAACPTDYIFAQPTTLTGSIGVLLPNYNYNELLKKIGLADTTIIASGATYKDAGSGSKPENAEHRRYFQDITDQMFTQFKDVVWQGRSKQIEAAKASMDQIANGKVFTASDAVKLGLVDKIGYLEDAVSYAASAAKLNKPMAVKFQEAQTLRDLLFGGEAEGKASGRGITVQVSPEMIDRMTTPRMMYLWRGE